MSIGDDHACCFSFCSCSWRVRENSNTISIFHRGEWELEHRYLPAEGQETVASSLLNTEMTVKKLNVSGNFIHRNVFQQETEGWLAQMSKPMSCCEIEHSHPLAGMTSFFSSQPSWKATRRESRSYYMIKCAESERGSINVLRDQWTSERASEEINGQVRREVWSGRSIQEICYN